MWQTLFLGDAPDWQRVSAGVLIGPLVAVFGFLCSTGNVPLARRRELRRHDRVLFADLIILPLPDVYRCCFGWRAALYVAAVSYASAVIAALVVDRSFSALGIVLEQALDMAKWVTPFALNDTFRLNLVALWLAVRLFVLNRRLPMRHGQRAWAGGSAAFRQKLV